MAKDVNQIEKLRIKNRESWFKMIILSAFSVVIIVKLLGSTFSINLSELNFTDVLSLLLALFSVGISVAFYFKATDTSNEFYNNTYQFTQEMSKILERINAGVKNLNDSVKKNGSITQVVPSVENIENDTDTSIAQPSDNLIEE